MILFFLQIGFLVFVFFSYFLLFLYFKIGIQKCLVFLNFKDLDFLIFGFSARQFNNNF